MCAPCCCSRSSRPVWLHPLVERRCREGASPPVPSLLGDADDPAVRAARWATECARDGMLLGPSLYKAVEGGGSLRFKAVMLSILFVADAIPPLSTQKCNTTKRREWKTHKQRIPPKQSRVGGNYSVLHGNTDIARWRIACSANKGADFSSAGARRRRIGIRKGQTVWTLRNGIVGRNSNRGNIVNVARVL